MTKRLRCFRYCRNAAAIVPLLLMLGSCRLVDLSPVPEYQVFPADYGALIAPGELPQVSFATDVDRGSVEAIFSIEDNAGRVSGNYQWHGTTVRFSPAEPFLPAQRYQLQFRGVFQDRNGRSVQALDVVPFFVGLDGSAALVLQSSVPQPGTTIDLRTELVLNFSQAIDDTNLVDIVRVTPDIQHDLVVTGSELRVVPTEDWPNVSQVTLRVSDQLTSTDGVRLLGEQELVYWAQPDATRPTVDLVSAAFDDVLLGFPNVPSGDDLANNLRADNVLAIQFSEAMDRDAVLTALSLFPTTDFTSIWFADDRLLLRLNDRWNRTTDYVLTITTDATDLAGLALATDYVLPFTPSMAELVPNPAVTVRDVTPPQTADNADPSAALPINVGPPSLSRLTFLIDFGGSPVTFPDAVGRDRVLSAIDVRAVFPSAAASPVLSNVSWTTDQQVTVEYTGFEQSTADITYYYTFTLGSIDGSREIQLLLRALM